MKRRPWTRVLALFTLASLAETVFYSQLLAFTPLHLPSLGVSDPDCVLVLVGLITAVSNGVGIPFIPLWGALADRYARKPIILRSFIVLLIAAAMAYLTQSLWVFILARSLTGFALGNSGLMMTSLAERVPANRIGLAFSIMNSAAPIGAFLGPLTGGWVFDRYGFRTLLAIDALMLAFVIAALVRGYHEEYRSDPRDKRPILRMAWNSLGMVWENRRLRALFPALFLLFGGWMLAFTYIPLVIGELYRGPDQGTITGIVIGASGLTTLVLAPLLGALADRFGSWRVLFAGTITALLLWPLPFWIRELLPFAILWSIVNGVVSAVFALSFAVLSSSAEPSVRGRVMSFAYMPVNVGFMVGAAVGARITQSSLFNIFPAAAFFTLLGILLLYSAYRQPAGQKGNTSP
ncbi:MAG: MFS transporter [Anaerolineales bacterium]|nr:MFS transporter [Anaerolineales bacterium]